MNGRKRSGVTSVEQLQEVERFGAPNLPEDDAIRAMPERGFEEIPDGDRGEPDRTLSPLLRPGTFVEIDVTQRKVQPAPPESEGSFDRPIYFVELREGFACGWCEIRGDRLFLLAHPNSGVPTRQFAYPQEAEIVGRVTGI